VLNGEGHVSLTTNVGNQAGSAFVPTPYVFGPADSFVVFFAYHALTNTEPPADGLAFVVQNTTSGPSFLGLAGSGLGFFTESELPAIGVTFDYYANGYTGSPAGTLAIAATAGADLAQTVPSLSVFGGTGAAGIRYVWVVYSNATNLMKVYYSNTTTRPAAPTLEMTLPQDLSSLCGGQIYLGFSAGTGEFVSVQSIDYLAVDVVSKTAIQ
jgi:hypothetical protein